MNSHIKRYRVRMCQCVPKCHRPMAQSGRSIDYFEPRTLESGSFFCIFFFLGFFFLSSYK